jgi:hypothetical protein
MSRYIVRAVYLEKPKRLIIWDRFSIIILLSSRYRDIEEHIVILLSSIIILLSSR